MMATFCPHCSNDIEIAINSLWVGNYWEFFDDYECPMCGKLMEIEVEPVPVFITHKSKNRRADSGKGE
jgi:acetone carboxylase gamma subunit